MSARTSAPLKVDPQTDELISHGAHLLNMTKKQFVDEAVRRFLDERRGELQARMQSMMATLDGSPASRVSLLSGLSPQEIEELGGVGSTDPVD